MESPKLVSSSSEDNSDEQGSLPLDETYRKLFQFKKKYILTPVKSGLMIIDQKRAHERILFEDFMQIQVSGGENIQQELFAQTIHFDQADYILLSELVEDMNKLGFDILDKGDGSLEIKAFPKGATTKDPKEVIDAILQNYKNTESDLKKSQTEKLSISLAKAAAIPYGITLSPDEMKNLVDRLFACSAPNYSPSGKTVLTILEMEEFDKKFK